MAEKEVEILDLGSIKPSKRVFKVADKEIDVTVIPFEIMLDIADNLEMFQSLSKKELKGSELKSALKLLYDITIKVCKNADAKIDEVWLNRNIDVVQMFSLMAFIIKPLFEKLGDEENPLLAELFEGKSKE